MVNGYFDQSSRRLDLRSSSRMASAVANALELVCPSLALEMDKVDLPSVATLSRATFKLDVAHMLLRRHQWSNWLGEHNKRSVQLCFDSSPLKRDYFLCYETTIESDRSILLCQDLQRNMNKEDASEDDPLFSLSGDIECRVLPPVALGKGDGTGGGHVDLEGQTSGPLNCCLRIGCPPCSFSEPIGFRPCSAMFGPNFARVARLPDLQRPGNIEFFRTLPHWLQKKTYSFLMLPRIICLDML
ncbi:unnamed protein product [Durusdinium trenchii]|uniref:Uncharacterized protein n=1 Tax=Durusdinium trenchii TaxID=1381693 RepID=A0ABP0HQU0_9DINO